MEKEFNNAVCVSTPTWAELLKFIQENIDPKFYDKPVGIIIPDDSEIKKITSIEVLTDPIYRRKGDDDSEDAGTMEDLRLSWDESEGIFDEDNYEVITEKGYPFLYFDEDEH